VATVLVTRGFLVLKAGVTRSPSDIEKEIVVLVREKLAPAAGFKLAITVGRLPKTRSGEILCGTIKKIADGDPLGEPLWQAISKVLEKARRTGALTRLPDQELLRALISGAITYRLSFSKRHSAAQRREGMGGQAHGPIGNETRKAVGGRQKDCCQLMKRWVWQRCRSGDICICRDYRS
jgi:hypothetical protein